MAIANTAQLTIVTRMYTALFNRAPDTAGLSFWANAMANGASQATVTQGFLTAPEGVAQYPAFQTASQFVTAFYTKVFGRTPDADGLAFWVAALNNQGGVESVAAKAALATQIIDVVSTPLSATDAAVATNAQTVADRAIFANKVDLGLYLAANSVVTVATANNLQGVTASPSSIDAAKGAVFASLVAGTANIVGSESADFISATVAQLNATATRTFDGGAGVDTLNLTSVGDAATIRTGSVSNIELIKLSGATTGTVNAATAFVGSTNVTLDGINTVTVSGLSGKTLGLSGATGTVAGGVATNSTIGADFGATATTAAVNLANTVATVAGVASNTTLTLTGAALTSATVTGSGNVALAATAATAALLKTLNVTSTAGNTITIDTTATAAALNTVDASTSTGAVKATLGDSAYKGGSGVDTVTLTAATTKLIDGGAGTADVIVINANADVLQASVGNVVNFETVSLGTSAAGTQTLGAAFKSILLDTAVAGSVNFANVAAGVDVAFKASSVADITYTLATQTTTDAVSVALNSNAALTGNKLTATGVETVNITATNTGAAAANSAHAFTLVDTAAKSIVVTGNTGLNLTNTGNTAVTSFDASAVTAGAITFVSANATVNTSVSIKGSLVGANTLTGGVTNDTIVGGAAADTISGGSGLDMLTGGAGNDTFIIGTNATTAVFSTITDFAKGDILNLTTLSTGTNVIADIATVAKVTLGANATLAQYLDAATAGVPAANVATAAWFQFGADTYVVVDNSAATVYTPGAAADQFVKLAGLVDLTTAKIAGELLTIA